jgi:hypothetical protein
LRLHQRRQFLQPVLGLVIGGACAAPLAGYFSRVLAPRTLTWRAWLVVAGLGGLLDPAVVRLRRYCQDPKKEPNCVSVTVLISIKRLPTLIYLVFFLGWPPCCRH